MTGWIIFGAWMLGAVLTFRPTARAVIGETHGGYDWEDVVFGALIGTLLVLCCWPLVGLYFALRRSTGNDASRAARLVFGESRAEKDQRLEREKIERERYIRELERQCGIGGDR